MSTESKERTYLILLEKVMALFADETGQPPIASVFTVQISKDPTGIPPDSAWFFTLVGPVTPTHYDTQKYRVTALEIATIVNDHTGSSFLFSDIEDVQRHTDATFIEITATGKV